MNSFTRYISVLLLILGLSSCKKESIENIEGDLNGVDRENIVEVSLPFTSGEGMENVIVTKAADMDSQLSSVLIMVYEAVDPARPELNQFVYSRFYNKATSGGKQKEGWFPDPNDLTRGQMKFTTPTGDVYIYLVANWTNSFIDYAVGVSEDQLKDPNNMPKNQQQLFEQFVPTWKGNVHRVDGLVPMIATVNNSTGLCHIDQSGNITYNDDNGANHTIAKEMNVPFTQENSFNFRRLMSKVTVDLKIGPKASNCQFTPLKYQVKNISAHIAPTANGWKDAGLEFNDFLKEVNDTQKENFSTQSPNSFTIYIPENMQPSVSGIATQPDRELMVKTPEGMNETYGANSPLAGKYKFQNAPEYATYIEIIGKYEDPANDIISADTRYFVHLGDFSSDKPAETRYGDFSLERDHHYQYTVSVNGVNDIIVESKDRKPEGGPETPSVDGLVFVGGLRAYCDAHYDQVELRMTKELIRNNDKGIVIFADTPYGALSTVYHAKGTVKGGAAGKLVDFLGNDFDLRTARQLLGWVELRKQNAKGSFVPYYNANEAPMDIFTALDECYNSKDDQPAYYTCFINEYYYIQHPITGAPVKLSDFINQRDRTFALGKDLFISKDATSICIDAIFLVYQKSISTFYDMNDTSKRKYGIESVNETQRFKGEGYIPSGNMGDYANGGYGLPQAQAFDHWNGWENTKTETGSVASVNWETNGWMLNTDNTQLTDMGKNRLKPGYQKGYLACMTRNRDFNGNSIIDAEELRWYTPAINQLLGIWIGQAAMPPTAALFPQQLTSSYTSDGPQGFNTVFTSTSGMTRLIWAEEGSSFGPAYQSHKYGGDIRAVRNLGFGTPDENDHHDPAETMEEYYFFNFDPATRTVEMQLAPTCLRSFSHTELEPHIERSPVNLMYRKIQIASQTMRTGGYENSFNAENAKGDPVTEAKNYSGNEPVLPGATEIGDWRLPNQRELNMLFILNPRFYDANGNKGSGNIHCRTTYTLNKTMSQKHGIGIYGPGFTEWGFAFNRSDEKFECMGSPYGAYFCVRDVR